MEAILNPGKDRVREVSSDTVNQKIDSEIARNVDHYSAPSSERINAKIKKLENEWDGERVFELNASYRAWRCDISRNRKQTMVAPACSDHRFFGATCNTGLLPTHATFLSAGVRTQKEMKQNVMSGLNK